MELLFTSHVEYQHHLVVNDRLLIRIITGDVLLELLLVLLQLPVKVKKLTTSL